MEFRRVLLCSAAAVTAAFGATTSFAEVADAPAASTAAPNAISEVVVTARRKSESLQSVPTAVTAFTQTALTEKSVASAWDLSRTVPGLTVSADSGNGGLASFSIRGKGQNYGAAAGSVETYFAEVPLSAPFQIPTLPAQFFDLQSLQVLKGPQGTLFGRSTTGGAVLIVPQAPTDRFEGYARAQGGNFGDVQLEGAINVPINDKAALRVAAFDWQRDGYMHTVAGITDPSSGKVLPAQTYANQDETELRATLLLNPTDNLENSTIATYHYDHTRSSGGAGLNIIGYGAPNGLGAFQTPGYGTRTTYTDTNLTKPASKIWALINTTTYKITPQLTFKNILGYIDAAGYTNDASDSDGTPIGAVSINLDTPSRSRKNQQLTDEVQFQGHNFNDRLSWTAGGLLDQTREPGGASSINYASYVTNFGSTNSTFEQNTVNSESLFGSATYKVNSKLNVSAGYRHTWDDVQFAQEQQAGGNPIMTGPLTHYETKLEGDTYNIDADYHVTNQLMVYGGYRRGYKHGGFNESQTDPALASFRPETVDDFYLGEKFDTRIWEMPIRINVEGYDDLYHDMQQSYLSFNGLQLTTVTTNVPETTFRGFDGDITAEPTPWLKVTGTYALIDAFITKWPDHTLAGYTGDLKSNPVPYVSRNKYTLSARLHLQLANNQGELALTPSVNYQDRFYTSALTTQLPYAEEAAIGGLFCQGAPLATAIACGTFNTVAHGGGYVPGYATFDLRGEWNHILGSRFNGAITATNLTNKLYYTGNSSTLNIGVQADAYGPPRMITVELSTKF